MRMEKLLPVLAIGVILLGACAGPSTPPAEIEVVSLNIVPPEVTAGETVSITAEVRNTGTSQSTYTAILIVDGVDVETKEIIVAAGATETITFSLVKDKVGSYKVGVGKLLSNITVKEKSVVKEVELKYDDGIVDNVFLAGPDGGHLIYFSPPSVPFAVQKVRVFGVLAGTGWKGRDFEVQLWDKSQKVLWSKNYAFTLFPKATPAPQDWRKTIDWVELEVPNIEVSDGFYIHVWTNDSVRHPVPLGIAMGADLSSTNEHCEGTIGYEVQWPYPSPKDNVNWMIRVVGMGIER